MANNNYEWYHVEELLPEDCLLCHFHTEQALTITTVLTMNKYGRMKIKNRLKVDKYGVPHLDEMATDGWIWSTDGNELPPEYWYPIPANEKFPKRKEKNPNDI